MAAAAASRLLHAAACQLHAAKAATAAEQAVEARLQRRLAELVAAATAEIAAEAEAGGLPAGRGQAERMAAPLTARGDELLEVLADEVGDVAAAAIAHVEQLVGGQAAELRDPTPAEVLPDRLRTFGMDRRLFQALARMRDSALQRMAARTVDALVGASEVGMPPSQLRSELASRLQGELQQISRSSLGDARNEATVVAEEAAGVEWHRWHTAGDDEVRPAHAAVGGQIAPVGGTFSNNWQRPGGVGCRCTVEPFLIPDGYRPPEGAMTFYEGDLEAAAA